MRILLVQHSSENVQHFPLGLAHVAAVLLEDGHQIAFLNLAFESEPISSLSKSIRNFKPQVLGFTLVTPQYGEFLNIMEQCEEARRLTVVAGGPHASAESERILRDGSVDVVVRCEGEVIAKELFHSLGHSGDLSEIRGIAYLNETGKYIQNGEGEFIEDLDSIPALPYDLFMVHRYQGRVHGLPAAEIQTSRGCPFKCIFCYRGPTGGKKVRFRSVSRVVQEMLMLHKDYGFRAFHFRDDIFTLQRSRTIELCTMLIAAKRRFYWTCETRVDRVDYELLSYMKRAGCVCIDFGVESGSQYVIDKLGKGITKEQAREAFRFCRELGIATKAFFMFGTPWDTPETIRETVDFAKELKSTITAFFSATPYPGTQLRDIFIREEIPIPEAYGAYRQFVEEKGLPSGRNTSSDDRQEQVRQICLRATAVIVRQQILDVKTYRRLIRELLALYGFADMLKRIFNRLPFWRLYSRASEKKEN